MGTSAASFSGSTTDFGLSSFFISSISAAFVLVPLCGAAYPHDPPFGKAERRVSYVFPLATRPSPWSLSLRFVQRLFPRGVYTSPMYAGFLWHFSSPPGCCPLKGYLHAVLNTPLSRGAPTSVEWPPPLAQQCPDPFVSSCLPSPSDTCSNHVQAGCPQ